MGKLTVQEELEKYAAYEQTSVTLKATLETGLGMMLDTGLGMKRVNEGGLSQKEKTLIQIASFLKRELPVRLARRVVELQNLPEGLHAMPSVRRVRDWCARRKSGLPRRDVHRPVPGAQV